LVLVADTGNRRIQAFNSGGALAWIWTGPAAGQGAFQSPTDIVVDDAGNRYISDFGARRINKYDANGAFITNWPLVSPVGEEPPERLAIDSQNNIYATATCWVFKFSTSGDLITRWGDCGTSGNGVLQVERSVSP
jgi:DNA-binding beta-propeller fold protein YncE